MTNQPHAKASTVAIASLSILLLAMTIIALFSAYFTVTIQPTTPILISLNANDAYNTKLSFINLTSQDFNQPISINASNTTNSLLRAKFMLVDKTMHEENVSDLNLQNWTFSNGYYYYNNVVNNDQNINLMLSLSLPNADEENYYTLNIEIESCHYTQNVSWTNIPTSLLNKISV